MTIRSAQPGSGFPGTLEAPRWRLSRIEIRPRLIVPRDVVARVELDHPERGAVSDIAAGPRDVDAIFAALCHITGLRGRLEGLRVSLDGSGQASACVAVRIGDTSFPGGAVAVDLLSACATAILEALHRAAGAGLSRS